ncbi:MULTISPECIES: nucleotidyltransferase family protein [unclassified Haematobacter]|uniref:nucleotidyltransferase family protein n=1 Tax=unclassified Haematobacter TaxID=2640585 RepID=UPI0025BAD895|nr:MULTISPECIES: nucleotidyltransferase family protein [unclassified Haematobacter]
MRVGLLLAGGLSRRFGTQDKLLADWRGRPLITWAASALAAVPLEARIAVAAADLSPLLPGYDRLDPPRPAEQSASLRLGVGRARAMGAERLLIVLADMPRIDTVTMAAVLSRGGAACVTDGARRMPPAAFDSDRFDTLLALEGDRGAGSLLQTIRGDGLIEVAPRMLHDIDRPADLYDSTGRE